MKVSFSKVLKTAAAAGACLVLAACSTKLSPEPFDANLRLTAGQVKMTVKAGVTTQRQIFEALGSPNMVALESGKGEIWTYDQIKVRRASQGYEAGGFFGSVFPYSNELATVGRSGRYMFPEKGGGVAGASVNGGIGTLTTSVHTATLIVRFDTQDRVASYKMLVSTF